MEGYQPFRTENLQDVDRAGNDALLYVMAHNHTIGVPTAILYFAEKLGVRAIAARDVHPAILADVNRAIDTIAETLRRREKLDQAETASAQPARMPCDKPNQGPMAWLQDRPIVQPPSPQRVDIRF